MKHVLFISYYFPPSGGPGVQRTLKFVKYLPQFGWQPTVLTVSQESAAYPDIDVTLEAEVPHDVEVIRTRSWDPYGGYAKLTGRVKSDAVGVSFVSAEEIGWKQRAARWIRANLFLPDARVGWLPFAVREAMRVIEQNDFDAIITTGPPHSSHLIGRSIARRTGLPWLADFRDPWTGVFYYADLPVMALARRLDARFEKSVLTTADAVTVVSPTMAASLAKRFQRSYDYLPNGFDGDDLRNATSVPDRFTIRHIGNLSPTQNPTALWRALAILRSEIDPLDVEVEFVGNVDTQVLSSARSHGVGDAVRSSPYVPHDEALRLMSSAAVLLLVIPEGPGAREIVTGKIFEYIGTGRPILGIGPSGGDADRILSETGAGVMFDWRNGEDVAVLLRGEYERFRSGDVQPRKLSAAVGNYDRRRLAERLAALLDKIANKAN